MNLRGVGHRYGLRGAWVLRGVDLALPARALVRVEGANGVGKSTLLRLLAGIDAPAEGRITGRPARTAYVPERFPAALPLTATGYLVHLGRIHGLRTAEAKRRAGEWLTRFGAADHARTPLAELSKGTSQKVAVAQALLAAPDLLVLDEAWTGLDTAARAELDRAVAERVAAGATVVFVDHDPRRLAGAADLTLRTADGGVHRAAAATAPGPDPGPRVLIEAAGPPGATLPAALPGDPVRERRSGTGGFGAGAAVSVPGGGPGTGGGTAYYSPGPGPGDGPDHGAGSAVVRLTVPAPYSDALLAALLTARPPWHIRQVAPAQAPVRPETSVRPETGEAPAPAESPTSTGSPEAAAEVSEAS
ncbi:MULTISPECIES: ATP-binding cassette domain-containing protein [Streptomyces]|uniref:ABC transporter ATP-binding protein n=1 Tax=Streptomyces TaxID=1883 RepID=UPI0029C1E44B|nr:ATP-binding cassette domain-containing protein [Streptomyces sp. ID01-9D]MDX5574977.1 ATP-binding cassette domain-containing protein [Streptomyces sp. ID01-9D]WSV26200.1 ATP-binding cassette domain-containing protein [Streptomyces fimicarius]